MSASTENRNDGGLGAGLRPHELWAGWSGPIGAGVKLPNGTIAAATSLAPGSAISTFTTGASKIALGFVDAGWDNTSGVQGGHTISVQQRTGTLIDLNAGGGSAIAATDARKPCYLVDNQTCSKLSTDGELGGVIFGLDPATGRPAVGIGPFFVALAEAYLVQLGDLSGSTGTFKTPTGTNTIGGNLAMASGKKITPSSATGGGIDPAIAGNTVAWTLGMGPLLATAGNDTACTNGDVFWAPVYLHANATITGVQYLIGSVGGTDKVIAALYSAAGVLLANSALAGATVGTTANVQAVDFTSPYSAVGPGLYYIALQFNGTTAKFRTHTVPGIKSGASTACSSVAGTFGTLASITPGTTYTANKGPIASTY